MLICSTSNGTIVVVCKSLSNANASTSLAVATLTFVDGHGGIGALSRNSILVVIQGLGPKTCFKAWFGRKASADVKKFQMIPFLDPALL